MKSTNATWKADGLYLPKARRPLVQLKPYKTTGLWVLHYDDGEESIPLNRTRAVEAAHQYAELRGNVLDA